MNKLRIAPPGFRDTLPPIEQKTIREASEELAPIFAMKDWHWRDEGVPNQRDIEDTILYLVSNLVQGHSVGAMTATGRIVIRWTGGADENDEFDPTYNTRFCIYLEF